MKAYRGLGLGMGDNGSHTTYLVGGNVCFAPRVLKTDRAMSSDWFPRPPTMYTRRGHETTVGAPVAQPWGEDNGSYYLPG
jgi:hypothetical protein